MTFPNDVVTELIKEHVEMIIWNGIVINNTVHDIQNQKALSICSRDSKNMLSERKVRTVSSCFPPVSYYPSPTAFAPNLSSQLQISPSSNSFDALQCNLFFNQHISCGYI